FEALSCAWGDQSRGIQTILLNNFRFPISPNLWDALHHLRSEEVGRVLWVGAICINQLDSVEKGSQIQKKGDIYQAASRVVIWLGKPGFDSDLAMDLVANMASVNL
ncbi:heterokaryon incompatibility, partial [Halenospora varia]